MLTAGFDKKKHNATQPLTAESEIWLYCAVCLISRVKKSHEIPGGYLSGHTHSILSNQQLHNVQVLEYVVDRIP